MTNYKNGKIYIISCAETDKCYIGSTAKIDLNQRFKLHEADYKRWMNGCSRYYSSFEIIQYPSAKIVLLENFPCNSKNELRFVEQEWIDRMKDVCVNLCKADTGIRADNEKEWRKQYGKLYYSENAEKFKAYQLENAEKIKEHKKIYNAANSENIKNYSKEYRKINAEKIKEYRKNKVKNIECDCGSSFLQTQKARHEKTKKHQKFLSS